MHSDAYPVLEQCSVVGSREIKLLEVISAKKTFLEVGDGKIYIVEEEGMWRM